MSIKLQYSIIVQWFKFFLFVLIGLIIITNLSFLFDFQVQRYSIKLPGEDILSEKEISKIANTFIRELNLAPRELMKEENSISKKQPTDPFTIYLGDLNEPRKNYPLYIIVKREKDRVLCVIGAVL